MLRARLRGAILVGKIASFLVHALLLELFMSVLQFSHSKRQTRRAQNVSAHSKSILNYARIYPSFYHLEKLREVSQGTLIVANHLSFWDILILSSQIPCLYVTSMEVRETPVLGWLAVLGGCVFVERRSRDQIGSEIEQIRSELKEGQRVVLFPEGTSSNGAQVLPFKRSLFRASVQAKAPILPIVINYRTVDGKPIDSISRDWIFYYGDHVFSEQLSHMFRVQSVTVDVEVLDPILPGQSEDAHQQACELSFTKISNRYHPVTDLIPS